MFPDAGFFLDAETVGGQRYYRELFTYIYRMANASYGLHPGCVQAHAGPGSEAAWRCMFPQYTVPFTKAPILPLQSGYDTYQLGNIFAPTWLPSTPKGWAACERNNSDCTALQRSQLNGNWRDQFLQALGNSTVLAGGPSGQGGLFLHSCWMHCQDGVSQWESLGIGGTTVRELVRRWWESDHGARTGEGGSSGGGDSDSFVLVDKPWPSNPYCPMH